MTIRYIKARVEVEEEVVAHALLEVDLEALASGGGNHHDADLLARVEATRWHVERHTLKIKMQQLMQLGINLLL